MRQADARLGMVPQHWEYQDFKAKVLGEGIRINRFVRLRYTNAEGEMSFRTVYIRAYLPGSWDGHIVGYCERRKEDRTFKLSRIGAAVDIAERKIILNFKDWLHNIAANG